MNMKLNLFLLACSFSSFANASSNVTPLPTTGFQNSALAQTDIPESFKTDLTERIKEEKIKGYHEEETTYPKYFLSLKKESRNEIIAYKDTNDTHLKADFSEIKLAFPFKGISPIAKSDMIGYAPIGSYFNDKNNIGWTGIKAFFTYVPIGTCAYSFFNLKMAHGGIQFIKEKTQYLVNGKPSATAAKGSKNSGFVYTVDWSDKENLFELECASLEFNKEALNKMIILAGQIDSTSEYK